ncbi:hypothetical protein J4211_05440 [Candidatus Woesearchaeota archaeon]|nr:hypothetical protein [Candidatus Woesearchaeota archaeon]
MRIKQLIEKTVTAGKGYYEFGNDACRYSASSRWNPTDNNYVGLMRKLFNMDKSDGKLEPSAATALEKMFDELCNPFGKNSANVAYVTTMNQFLVLAPTEVEHVHKE